MRKETQGFIEVILASIIRGCTQSTVPKLVIVPITTLLFFRMFVPTLFILFYSKFTHSPIRSIISKDVIKFHLYSLLVGVRTLLFLYSYKIGSVVIGTLIFFSSIAFITFLEPLVLGGKLSKRNFVLSLLCFIGLLFTVLQENVVIDSNTFYGAVIMVFSVILVIIETLLNKKWIHELSNNEWVFFQHFGSSLLFLPFVFMFTLPGFNEILYLLVFGILTGVLSYILKISAMKKIKLSAVQLVTYVEVITAIGVGVLLFNEVLTFQTLIGGSIILLCLGFVKK